jgi:hypothetical protein
LIRTQKSIIKIVVEVPSFEEIGKIDLAASLQHKLVFSSEYIED